MSNNERNNNSQAYLALGSNKGDRLSFLKDAANEFNNSHNSILKASSVYETKPYGLKDQQNFYNAVIKIETQFALEDLFKYVKSLEDKLGRQESVKWGPREIDIDILFYDDLVYSDENLTVPHKGIPHRDFVITPLIEIEPDIYHPALKQKISDICITESEKTIIRIIHKQLF